MNAGKSKVMVGSRGGKMIVNYGKWQCGVCGKCKLCSVQNLLSIVVTNNPTSVYLITYYIYN